jgi:hypothetical protein
MGQTLKFYARKDLTVNARPGWTPPIGQPVPTVNRALVIVDGIPTWPAQPEPFVCESDSPVGRHILRAFSRRSGKKDPPLWPADEATAHAVAQPFVRVDLVDGEWVPSKAPEPKTSRKPAPSADKD